MHEAEKIWMNGALVDWADARVHVLSHGLHYGTSVFEGIRAYATDDGPAVFRLDDHLARLERSAEIYYMPIPYSRDELRDAVHAVIAANDLEACYIRPIVLRGYGTMGLFPLEAPVDVVHRRLGVGRLPGRGRPAERASGPRWRAGGASATTRSRRRPRPAASTSTRSWPRSSRTRPGYQEAILLNEAGATWPTARGRTSSWSGTGVLITPAGARLDPRGHHPRHHHRAGRGRGLPRSLERDVARGRAVPRRRGVHYGHRGRGLPGQRGRRPPARARPGRSRGRFQERFFAATDGTRPALGRLARLRGRRPAPTLGS